MRKHQTRKRCGQVAEWLKAADCKSARFSVRWFESSPVHQLPIHKTNAEKSGKSQLKPAYTRYVPSRVACISLHPEPSVGVSGGEIS